MKGGEGNAPSVPANTETYKISRQEDLRDELLPSIPNSIALQVIAPKLSVADVNTLSVVSRRWQEAIHSRWIYDARVRSHTTETFVFWLYQDVWDNEKHYGPRLYSLKENSVYYLPPIPGPIRILCGCQCIPLDGKIYVLGGLISKSSTFSTPCGGSREVFMLDLVGHKSWKQCASMQEVRSHFGAGVLDGKIYVVGGRNDNTLVHKCEVYDPTADAWSSIADMIPCRVGHRVDAVRGELFVYSGLEHPDDLFDMVYPRYVVAYNPVRNEWRQLRDHVVGDEFAAFFAQGYIDTGLADNPWHDAFVAHGKFHTFFEPDAKDLRVYDVVTESWSRLHSYSIQSFFEGINQNWAFGYELLMREYLRNGGLLEGRYGSRGNNRLLFDLHRQMDGMSRGMCFIQV